MPFPSLAGHPRFRAIALVNPPNRSYTVQEMPADFVRRFNVLDVDYMKAKDEVDFVMDTVFLDESTAKKAQLKPLIEQLVGLANDLRSSYRQGHLPRPLRCSRATESVRLFGCPANQSGKKRRAAARMILIP